MNKNAEDKISIEEAERQLVIRLKNGFKSSADRIWMTEGIYKRNQTLFDLLARACGYNMEYEEGRYTFRKYGR